MNALFGGLKSGEGDMNWPMYVQLAAILGAALGLAVFIRNLIKDLRAELHTEIAGLRTEIAGIRAELHDLQQQVNRLSERVARIEGILASQVPGVFLPREDEPQPLQRRSGEV